MVKHRTRISNIERDDDSLLREEYLQKKTIDRAVYISEKWHDFVPK